MSEFIGERRRVDPNAVFASAADIEQPLDPGSLGVSSPLPACQFTAQGVAAGDAPVQTLLYQHPDLDFHQIEPTRVLGDEVKLQAALDLASDLGREDFVQRRGFMGREIVEHHPDRLSRAVLHLSQCR